ncbi:MAG: hypothetical protein ACK40L_17225 [Hydrogenophaga sp.]
MDNLLMMKNGNQNAPGSGSSGHFHLYNLTFHQLHFSLQMTAC